MLVNEAVGCETVSVADIAFCKELNRWTVGLEWLSDHSGLPEESICWTVSVGDMVSQPMSVVCGRSLLPRMEGCRLTNTDVVKVIAAYRHLWAINWNDINDFDRSHLERCDARLREVVALLEKKGGREKSREGMSFLMGNFLQCVREEKKVKPKSHRGNHVYFIVAKSLVKIGRSHNPKKRLRQLANSDMGRDLILACVITPHDAVRCERKLHAMFDADRQHGEWFAYSDRIKAFIAKLTNVEKPNLVPGMGRK